MPRNTTLVLTGSAALLATGVLTGAFFYGWANVAPTFGAVPLDVHLTFRTELMKMNGIVMQALMAASIATSGALAIVAGGRARTSAIGAALLAVTAFLVTRFGNVPINQEMKIWATGGLAPDFQERLAVWDTFHDIRVAAALGAFALVIIAVQLGTSARREVPPRCPGPR
ncbi:protein of unknown function [Saccharopolyspora kobensis]|uniref:DUF1772 domain-containing protein n=1 Tax=Saccharopolyspora kobensis TaxID=146035 RepID=A0A1H6D281_9PSEU|nr:DUF1772 domain-containing protein [Saccharopolyspora kobensis]SEG79108.1 protein of unknown function [Saccharopolyspora kobensis]SFD07237.1 protein of unknown function [Saccharopolyspora kobensis]